MPLNSMLPGHSVGQAADGAQQGRLAAAAGAYERDELGWRYFKADIAQHFKAARVGVVAVAEAVDGYAGDGDCSV